MNTGWRQPSGKSRDPAATRYMYDARFRYVVDWFTLECATWHGGDADAGLRVVKAFNDLLPPVSPPEAP